MRPNLIHQSDGLIGRVKLVNAAKHVYVDPIIPLCSTRQMVGLTVL